jgi:hypothetical protein
MEDIIGADTEVSFVKIDVEGHEPEVLEGATSTLVRSPRGLLMFEANRIADSIAVIERLGWAPFALDEDGRPTAARDRFAGAQNLFACGPQHPLIEILRRN